jgi:hypothetical protein
MRMRAQGGPFPATPDMEHGANDGHEDMWLGLSDPGVAASRSGRGREFEAGGKKLTQEATGYGDSRSCYTITLPRNNKVAEESPQRER